MNAKQEYTITVYTENQIGLINRIAIIFSRRKINIESLNTSPSEVEGIHRFTIVINETEEVVRKLCRQLEKQVEILKAYYIEAQSVSERKDLRQSLKTMLDHNGAYLLEVFTGKENNVFPMVPQGCSVSEIRLK